MKSQESERTIVANNPKASHDYFLDEKYECGISLVGTEVKSIRNKKVNIKDSFAQLKNGEIILINMHISPYDAGSFSNLSPTRNRKLLLHKKEIAKIYKEVSQKGVTLVPTSVYFVKNKVKIEIAVARGKKLYDKRESIAKKDAERRMLQAGRN